MPYNSEGLAMRARMTMMESCGSGVRKVLMRIRTLLPRWRGVLVVTLAYILVYLTLLNEHRNIENQKCQQAASSERLLNRSEWSASFRATSASEARPYGEFCDTKILGEKQTWNPRKKIISYALFSSDGDSGSLADWLIEGLQHNVEGAKLYYPDWVVRVHAIGLSQETIQEILNLSTDSVEVVKCHASNARIIKSPGHRMLVRFLPYDDPTVYYTIVRDVDGRFSPRELLAVHQWMSYSDLKFHTMRDHEYHVVPIMGGMFGMKRSALGTAKHSHNTTTPTTTMTELVRTALKEFPDRVPGCCAYDQNFLARYVWPRVKHTAVDHDMNPQRCKRFQSALCLDWPLGPRDASSGLYVGACFKDICDLPGNSTGYACTLQCKAQ